MTSYTLQKPIRFVLSGVHGPRREEEIGEVTLRPMGAGDFTLLEKYKGQPATLALYGTAALSGLSVAKIKRLDFDDYAVIAGDVLQRFARAAAQVGLRPDYFIPPKVGA